MMNTVTRPKKLHDKYSNYKNCVVRECKNTTIRTPGKLWIRVPTVKELRDTWLRLAKRDPQGLSKASRIYFCEDHFDLENDMLNYLDYKRMGYVARIRMKLNCIPTRFECHKEVKHKKKVAPIKIQHPSKKKPMLLILGNNIRICPIKIFTSPLRPGFFNKNALRSSTSSLQKIFNGQIIETMEDTFILPDSPHDHQNSKKEVKNIEMVVIKEEIEIKTEIKEEYTDMENTEDQNINQPTQIEIKIERESDTEENWSEGTLQTQDHEPIDPTDTIIKKEVITIEEEMIIETCENESRPKIQKNGGLNKSANDKTIKRKKQKKQREKEFTCSHCDYKSIRKYDMTRHCRRIHIQEKQFSCDYCDHKSTRKQDLVGHIRSHTGERPFSCEYCDKKFPLKSDLTRHLKVHKDDNPFKCDYCGSTFTQKSNLARHLTSHSGAKPFECNFCGNKFTQKSNLARHVALHKGEKPFTCKVCARTFAQKIHLTQHMRTHTGERPFVCIYCSKTFSQKRLLTGHVRVHRGEKPYSCNYCGNEFTQKSYLSRHLRLHMGPNPYSCKLCGQKFALKFHLTDHMSSHSEEMPFAL